MSIFRTISGCKINELEECLIVRESSFSFGNFSELSIERPPLEIDAVIMFTYCGRGRFIVSVSVRA